MREVSGCVGRDGACLAPRRLYRWSPLDVETGADVRRFAVRTVIDTSGARVVRAHRAWAARSYVHAPLGPPDVGRATCAAFPEPREVVLTAMEPIAEILAAIAGPTSPPIAVGCSTTPDLSGTVIALLLAWLGVPDEQITARAVCRDRDARWSPIDVLRSVREEFRTVDAFAAYLGMDGAPTALRCVLLDGARDAALRHSG